MSGIFRSIEAFRPTLVIDEMDTVLDHPEARAELRGILNSGHRRTSASVVRVVGENFEPRLFSTWCPKILAKIGGFPDTLADRSIALSLQRKKPSERVDRLRLDHLSAELKALRSRCARWALDNFDDLSKSNPAVPLNLNDRAADNWRPLLAIADLAGGPWPELARKAACASAGIDGEPEDRSKGVALLRDIRQIFDRLNVDRLSSADLIRSLSDQEDRPWLDWNRGRPITPRQVATLLRDFGVTSKSIRIGDATPKGYLLEAFEEPFLRYLPDRSAT